MNHVIYNVVFFPAEPGDYIALNETLVLQGDQSSPPCVNITVNQDNLTEANERFQLHLLSGDLVLQVTEPSLADVVIVNSDGTFIH